MISCHLPIPVRHFSGPDKWYTKWQRNLYVAIGCHTFYQEMIFCRCITKVRSIHWEPCRYLHSKLRVISRPMTCSSEHLWVSVKWSIFTNKCDSESGDPDVMQPGDIYTLLCYSFILLAWNWDTANTSSQFQMS